MLTSEFFKHLGNLSYDELATLARHMPQPDRQEEKQPYPKVTVKSMSSVLDSCYTGRRMVRTAEAQALGEERASPN